LCCNCLLLHNKNKRKNNSSCALSSKIASTGCGYSSSPAPAPKLVLNSALKRSEPTESNPEGATILSSKKPLILSPIWVNISSSFLGFKEIASFVFLNYFPDFKSENWVEFISMKLRKVLFEKRVS